MTDTDRNHLTEPSTHRSRRSVFKLIGGALLTPFGLGASAYQLDRSYEDADEDGAPDSVERSATFADWLRSVFGADQFEGFDPTRRDLLVDVRYIGETTVSAKTKTALVELFRANGIYLQWLDYPHRYDRRRFERSYGYNARRILWSPWSFYHRTIERRLKNVAFQLIVVPGFGAGPQHRKLYSPSTAVHTDSGYVSGLNTGNRAVVASSPSHVTEAKLILHELAHYAVCHSTDPANTGVMGTQDNLDLMDNEWEALRAGLDAVRDTTGFDVAFRRCLWSEFRPSLPLATEPSGDCSGCRGD